MGGGRAVPICLKEQNMQPTVYQVYHEYDVFLRNCVFAVVIHVEAIIENMTDGLHQVMLPGKWHVCQYLVCVFHWWRCILSLIVRNSLVNKGIHKTCIKMISISWESWCVKQQKDLWFIAAPYTFHAAIAVYHFHWCRDCVERLKCCDRVSPVKCL